MELIYCLNVGSIADSPYFSSFYTKTHPLSEYHNIICFPHWLITHSTLTIYVTSHHPYLATYFQKSFFPRTITDWNNSSDNIIESGTLDNFTLSLKLYDYNWHSGLDPINIITL